MDVKKELENCRRNFRHGAQGRLGIWPWQVVWDAYRQAAKTKTVEDIALYREAKSYCCWVFSISEEAFQKVMATERAFGRL